MRFAIRGIIAAALSLCPAIASAAPCAGFTDVDDGSPFCASVQWLRNQGITQGCTPTAFCPDAAVSRVQVAAFHASRMPLRPDCTVATARFSATMCSASVRSPRQESTVAHTPRSTGRDAPTTSR